MHFFYQATEGQLALLNRGRPIEEVRNDPTTDPKLADLLGKIGEVKKFGEKFGLKPTSNYSEYVKLDRDSVVYVVTVSDALEFKVKIFSFPVAGSFNYIGWFSEKDALKFANGYRSQGYDVDVRGASAYSTLGWFKDPLLSTMIPKHEGVIDPIAYPNLVNVVIHESVHATLYLKDQSYFNESVASFVADILTKKYFSDLKLLDSSAWKTYAQYLKNSEQKRKKMIEAYRHLKLIYATHVSEDEKRLVKKDYLENLQKEVGFDRPINNATLVQFQTYESSDHGFEALLAKEHGNIQGFLSVLSKLKSSHFKNEHQETFNVMELLP